MELNLKPFGELINDLGQAGPMAIDSALKGLTASVCFALVSLVKKLNLCQIALCIKKDHDDFAIVAL